MFPLSNFLLYFGYWTVKLTLSAELDLPEYDSYEALRERLYTAMTAGGEYFGFA